MALARREVFGIWGGLGATRCQRLPKAERQSIVAEHSPWRCTECGTGVYGDQWRCDACERAAAPRREARGA